MQKDATLEAITVFNDSLPPNITSLEIEIKYAFKCADGSGGWAGLSSTKGSPEKWRQALKANNLGSGELGVFHIPLIPMESMKEFPYSFQTTQDATGATWTRVSIKFATEQVAFDAPPTLEVGYLIPTRFFIYFPQLFYCKGCIAAATAAFSVAMYDDACRRAKHGSLSWCVIGPCKAVLYAHSVYGRSDQELGEEEYNKMRKQHPAVIYLEAKYTFQ